MKQITLTTALLMTLSSPVVAQDFDKGVAAPQTDGALVRCPSQL